MGRGSHSHRRLPSSPIVVFSPLWSPAALLCVTPENLWGLMDQGRLPYATRPGFVPAVWVRSTVQHFLPWIVDDMQKVKWETEPEIGESGRIDPLLDC